MINKKGFLIRDFVVAGVLSSLMIAMFVLAIAGIQNEYNSDLLTNPEFADNYDQLTDQVGKIETARSTAAAGEGLNFLGTFDVVFQSTFTAIQLVFSTLNLFGDMTGSFAEDFGFDPLVTQTFFIAVLAILTALIVYLWISSISRGKL